MKLLAIENRQFKEYYKSRYEQVAAMGVDLFILNGRGEPDFWPADRYRIVGSQHIDDLIATARDWHRDEKFDGVLTFSESAVITVAAVAEALGLPGIGVAAAVASRNKQVMRTAHESGGVPHPRFRFVTDKAAARPAAAEFGYPVVIKPTLGAASNFVFRVDDASELDERFDQAMAGSADMVWAVSEAEGIDAGPVGLIVESFLDGSEHLMEILVWDDEVYLGSVVDRITAEGDTFDDDGHHAPTALSAADLMAVHEAVTAAARAQGLRRTVGHAEVRFHQGKPYVLEIAVRVGGGGLDMIARLTADYDPIAAVVDIARGVRPKVRHYQPTGKHITAMCLICPAGVVDEVLVPAEVAESDRVFLLKITARPGDLILRPPDGNSIVGFLGTTGTSLDDAFSTMTDYAERIVVTHAHDPAPA